MLTRDQILRRVQYAQGMSPPTTPKPGSLIKPMGAQTKPVAAPPEAPDKPPPGRAHYCQQCADNVRKNYDLGIPVGPGYLGFLGALGPALVAQLLSGCPPSIPTQHPMVVRYDEKTSDDKDPDDGAVSCDGAIEKRRQYAGPLLGAGLMGFARLAAPLAANAMGGMMGGSKSRDGSSL